MLPLVDLVFCCAAVLVALKDLGDLRLLGLGRFALALAPDDFALNLVALSRRGALNLVLAVLIFLKRYLLAALIVAKRLLLALAVLIEGNGVHLALALGFGLQ